MTKTALILAAHGAGETSQANALLLRLAEVLRARGRFAEVVAAFNLGAPKFADVLALVKSNRAVVIPIMTSEGYFSETVLPRELAKAHRYAECDVRITKPIGTHPGIADLFARRTVATIQRYELEATATSLIVVGHGTERHKRSREATDRLVKELRRRGTCVHVAAAFLDEAPRIVDSFEHVSTPNVVVMPFLIGGGYHATHDIPRQAGLRPNEDGVLPVAGKANGRFVVCTDALGAEPELAELIEEMAWRDCKCVFNRQSGTQLASNGQTACGGSALATETTQQFGVFAHSFFRRTSGYIGSGGEPRVGFYVTSGIGRYVHDGRPGQARRTIRLGTRGSALALWQARHVADKLLSLGCVVELVEIATLGDQDKERPIHELGSPAPFADEIEEALLDGKIDIAVHSLKDLPVESRSGLTIAAVLERGDPREALVSRLSRLLDQLPSGAVVGTSSPRRAAQLRHLRGDLRAKPIRGAVEDRVRQVRRGDFDAAILAAAGLERLGMLHEAAEIFAVDQFVPAPAQAALAVQVRVADVAIIKLIGKLDHWRTRQAVTAELEFLRPFESNRKITAAAHAVQHAESGLVGSAHPTSIMVGGAHPTIVLHARLTSIDGSMLFDAMIEGTNPIQVASDALDQAGTALSIEREVRA